MPEARGRGCGGFAASAVRSADIFPAPEERGKTLGGGILAILGISIVTSLSIYALVIILNSPPVISVEETIMDSHTVYTSPPLMIEVKRLGQRWLNTTEISVTFIQRTIYEANTDPNKPSTYEQIPTISCEIHPDGSVQALQGFCPQYQGQVSGKFSTKEFNFISIIIGRNTNSITADRFIELGEGVTVTLWINEKQLTSNSFQWTDAVFIDAPASRWIGVETFLEEVIQEESMWFHVKTSRFMRYSKTSQRIADSRIRTRNELIKLYIRADSSGQQYNSTVFNSLFALPILSLLAFFGGLGSVIYDSFELSAFIYKKIIAKDRGDDEKKDVKEESVSKYAIGLRKSLGSQHDSMSEFIVQGMTMEPEGSQTLNRTSISRHSGLRVRKQGNLSEVNTGGSAVPQGKGEGEGLDRKKTSIRLIRVNNDNQNKNSAAT